MKVITEGFCYELVIKESFVGEAECPRCCSVLEYTAEDVADMTVPGTFENEGYILCPVCKNIFKVDIE